MSKHYLCPASEISVGKNRVFKIGRHSFGVYKVDGGYYAIRDYCPHQGGPLCSGGTFDYVTAELVEGTKVREFVATEKGLAACPWHGVEFDVRTGECLVKKEWKVKTYNIQVDMNNNLHVVLPD